MSLTLRVLSRPDVAALPLIYSNLGLDFDDRVLPSIGNEVHLLLHLYQRMNIHKMMDRSLKPLWPNLMLVN